uniref:Protein kinase domain-containing protein n=1 Tax=Oryzias latipes TaxID=8090 RepID=A0A3P9HK16_ORYLA
HFCNSQSNSGRGGVEVEGGLVECRPPKHPPSQRADCLATANQPNIFGRGSQPIERVKAGFSSESLLVLGRKNNVSLLTPSLQMKLIKDLDPDQNHLIKMFECFTFHRATCIVYELLDVSLFDSYKRVSSTRTHLCLIRHIAQQLLKALKALKSIGVAHCDIKLDNIMFTDPDSVNVKLIDFGLAVETKKLSTITDIQVPPFRAPEVILGIPLDESVDMWALGVVLACVYFGNYPFPSKTEYETIRAMVQIFGLPEPEVLHKAKNKAAFFTRDNGDWRLCTPEEYTESTGQPSQALEHDFITMKHLAEKSKAVYAGKARKVMGKTPPSEAQVNPSASSSSSMSGSSYKSLKSSDREIADISEKPVFQENLEKTEVLQTDKNKAKKSSGRKKEKKSFGVKKGQLLVGNLGTYRVEKFLGEGNHGKVTKCSKLGSQEMFAIKILEDVNEGKEESEAMKLIEDLDPDENNLIKFYECFSYKNVICLVYEILDECLCDCLEDDDPTDLCNIRAIALQMFQALHALKSVGVVHGDIKLDNIMFAEKESLRIKLIDFGFAMKAKNLLKGTNIQVTPFRAPEVLLGLPLDESIDMWGLGVVLSSLYYGNYPFPSETEYETIRAMVQIFGLPEEDLLNAGDFTEGFFTWDDDGSNSGWRLLTPDEYTQDTGEELEDVDHVMDLDQMTEIQKDLHEDHDDDDHRAFIDLLKRMLEVNPQRRITPSQALEHDFITMKHLAGENKAKYAAKAKDLMGQIQLEEKEKKT